MESQHSKNANWWLNVNEDSGSGAALVIPAVMGHWGPPERMTGAEDMKMTPDGPSLPRAQ